MHNNDPNSEVGTQRVAVPENIREQLKLLPNSPGVYLMRSDTGRVVYVGKAVSLKNRVRSYFQNSRRHSPKTEAMVSQVASIDYIVVDSEVEALILENNLIKEHDPRYNIRLKDDKTYPYIKVTVQEPFPRFYSTRKRVRDGARYFGPYTDVGAMHETVRMLKQLFPLRDCRKPIVPDDSARPCLNYHIKRCMGPCICGISSDDYRDIVLKIERFLEGKHDSLVKQLRSEMNDAAANMEYELAASLRDQLCAVEKVIEKQKIVSDDDSFDADVISLARQEALACVQVFLVRDGRMVGREHYYLEVSPDDADNEIIAAFLTLFYSENPQIPKEIILQHQVPETQVVEEWLSAQKGSRVSLHMPRRGDKVKLVEMGVKNAQVLLERAALTKGDEESRLSGALADLCSYLGLSSPPFRMECYDISNIQGSQTVASMVVFESGKPKKSDYRRFRIKTVDGPNDFASMAEVIGRRFQRAVEEDEHFGVLPDLVIIDGGKGQLNSALEEMTKFGFGHVPAVGLAKEFEYLFQPGKPDPIILPRESEALYLVQRIRDEAHRFAIAFHRELRGKAAIKSVLDEIPGVGKKRRLALLQAFGSVDKMRIASVEQLTKVEGMTKPVAQQVYEHLRRTKRAKDRSIE